MKTLKNYVRPSVLRKRLAQSGIKTTVVYYDKDQSTLGTLARKVYKLTFKNGLFVMWADVKDDGSSWQYAIYHALPSGEWTDKDLIIEGTNLDQVLVGFGRYLANLAEKFARIAEALK
ncbi:MAG: hypothetical protein IT290_13265 [Deltaproteobacteria bacterium]|nr:hypothetical protein [Deltaproteobacteria bacterium]